MDVLVEHTREDIFGELYDLNFLLLQKYKTPLIVLTRDKQAYRLNEWIHKMDSFLPINVISMVGVWDLDKEEYLTEAKTINMPKWKEHDVIIFLDPDRSDDNGVYKDIINQVASIATKKV